MPTLGNDWRVEEVGRIPVLLVKCLKLFPSSSPGELHMGWKRGRELESTICWWNFESEEVWMKVARMG